MDPGESLAECVIRETAEDIVYTVQMQVQTNQQPQDLTQELPCSPKRQSSTVYLKKLGQIKVVGFEI